jgi:ankyrin repeat protein
LVIDRKPGFPPTRFLRADRLLGPSGSSAAIVMALHIAASEGKLELVEQLVRMGLNPNTKVHGGVTAMHSALMGGAKAVATALWLINECPGVDLNAGVETGMTPLAIGIGVTLQGEPVLPAIRALIARGADCERATGPFGQPMLKMAAAAEKEEIALALLDAGVG